MVVRQRFFWIFWLHQPSGRRFDTVSKSHGRSVIYRSRASFALAGRGLQPRIESRPGLVSRQIMLPFVARPTFPRTFARPSASVLGGAARFGGASHRFDRSNACYDSRTARLARRLLPATRRSSVLRWRHKKRRGSTPHQRSAFTRARRGANLLVYG